MTEERFEEIRAEYENAKDVEYVRWQFAKDGTPSTVTDSQASEDMFDLIAEVARQNIEIADRENSHIALYNDYQTEKAKCSATLQVLIGAEEEIARLRKALEFYADSRNYQEWRDGYAGSRGTSVEILRDYGRRAKGALQNGEG